MLDSLVRVSRRVEPHPIVSFSEWIRPRSCLMAPLTTPPSLPLRSSTDYNKWARKLTSPFYAGPEQKQSKLTSRKERTWSDKPELKRLRFDHTTKQSNSSHPRIPPLSTGVARFPLCPFKYSFTLFSKFFSSFPHGTCSLSVSRLYLAFDETYHRLRAAIPNNSTRRTRVVHAATSSRKTGFSPFVMSCFKELTALGHADVASTLDNSAPPDDRPILRLSSARFTRRYWEHHGYCLVLPLVICLNSGGSLASREIICVVVENMIE